MINANEIREITQDIQSKFALEYIEQIIEPHIKVRAEYGYSEASFFYPSEPIDIEEVIAILEDNGYDIGTVYSPYQEDDIGFKVIW